MGKNYPFNNGCLMVSLKSGLAAGMLVLNLVVPEFPAQNCLAQPVRGNPFVYNYSSSGDYRADRDVWDAVMDSTGTLFFGNAEGVLTYNGSDWTLIPFPEKTSGNALIIDRKGTVYAGSDDEFGYFNRSSSGLTYRSLMGLLPDSLQSFGKIWSADTLGKSVFFQSFGAVFCLTGNQISVFPAKKQLSFIYRDRNRLLLQDPGAGLLLLTETGLKVIDSSAFFKEMNISQIASAASNSLFLFTRQSGTYLYKDGKISPLNSDLGRLSRTNRFYCTKALPDGEILIGTVGAGAVIADSTGKIVNCVSVETGLKTNTIMGAFYDGKGSVWLCTYEGISRISYPSAATFFRNTELFGGLPKTTVNHNGVIYQGTLEAFFRLTENQKLQDILKYGSGFQFTRVDQVREDCGMAISIGKEMLVATNQGVFLINDAGKKLITRSYALPLTQSRYHPERVFIGTYGLQSIIRKDGHWSDEGFYHGITEDIYHVFEESDTVLWLRSYNQGILRVVIEPGNPGNTSVRKFTTLQGLPSLQFYPAEIVEGKIRWLTENGVYTFNSGTSLFEPDREFYALFPGAPKVIDFLAPAGPDQFWVTKNSPDGSSVYLFKKNTAGIYQAGVSPFIPGREARIQSVITDPAGVSWFSVVGGVIRYDPSGQDYRTGSFRTQIRSVKILPSDSVIAAFLFDRNARILNLDYPDNSFRFQFSALSYSDESRNQYRYFLEGYDDGWSGWTGRNVKDYTNLDPGIYTFHVQSVNGHGFAGKEARFIFRLHPPWWKSPWFLSVGILITLWLGYLIFQRRVNKLTREKKAQEEISRQLINLQENERKRIARELHDSISQSLLAINNRARMAGEKMDQPGWVSGQLEVILSSSSGAIQEIRQITHDLRPYLLDRIGLTRSLQSLLRQFRETNPVSLRAEIDEIDGLLKPGDDIHLYRIIQELLNNIQKHSKATGVTVLVQTGKNELNLVVADNGIGMGPAVSAGTEKSRGLGLDGIAERIRILGGRYKRETKPGKGVKIAITLPIGRSNG